MRSPIVPVVLALAARGADGAPRTVAIEAPRAATRFDPAEFVLRVTNPAAANPFTEVEVTARFERTDGARIRTTPVAVDGFCDDADGKVFRVRWSPEAEGEHRYRIAYRDPAGERAFEGAISVDKGASPGPVIADPRRPRHFIRKGTGEPFFHLGYTAYHLLDPGKSDADVRALIDGCAARGFNKIRFLLAGYPRDTDRRTSSDVEHGVPDFWKRPNYGAPPGSVLPLPAWEGEPHAYDFARFHLPHWRKVERAIRAMRAKGIVATVIFTIEKQNLPREYGRETPAEIRFYRYAVARLAAFDNVWWDLGNEHNEYRDPAWANAMGARVRGWDPYDRLASAHGYAEFRYADSPWAGFIITQQYGDERTVHDWALEYAAARKPYVNEEYGYEGDADKPGHRMDADWVRRCHWSIAMAGGYATYGDWGDDCAFYSGRIGRGKAPADLGRLKAFFEALPFADLEPSNSLASAGFCLARAPDIYLIYLPRGGATMIDLSAAAGRTFRVRWFDPRSGAWGDGGEVAGGARRELKSPAGGDTAALIDARPAGTP
ncbi:MAG: DUF4038 domain-containing protein [Planctomycetes bacterium]|nr:DUF4038 domain-containing protein [Planctomycetota bacterium]